jgi:hypothetical protein
VWPALLAALIFFLDSILVAAYAFLRQFTGR